MINTTAEQMENKQTNRYGTKQMKQRQKCIPSFCSEKAVVSSYLMKLSHFPCVIVGRDINKWIEKLEIELQLKHISGTNTYLLKCC